jgi:aspartate aminotransferase
MSTNLASRVTQLTPSLTLTIDSKAKAMKAEGIDIIGFGAGEPDFDTPEHIKAAAMGSLDAGFTKYTPAAGIPELRQAISDKLKADNNLEYKPTQIIVTNGAKHACLNVILATIEPGDEVIIPAPYWLSYPEMVKLAGGTPVCVSTLAENNYKITPQQFEEAMSPATRMIILNTPGNPTGTLYTKEELHALAEVALSEDILILSDEIYEKLTYDGHKHISIAGLSQEIYESTFTVNGFSKPYAMTGWRIGYVAAPEWATKAIESMQSHSTSNVNSFAQKGALAAYKGPQDCVVAMLKEYDTRRKKMMALLDAIPHLSYVKPQGAFYILVDISKTKLNSTDFAERLLDRQKVAVVPGIAFGDDRTIRLSYATSIENIETGIQRIAEFIATLTPQSSALADRG